MTNIDTIKNAVDIIIDFTNNPDAHAKQEILESCEKIKWALKQLTINNNL